MSKVAMTSVISLAVAATFAASSANAGLIYKVSGPGIGTAETAEQTFFNNLQGGFITETFESFAAGTQQGSFSTAVGSFEGITPGTGGACNNTVGGISYSCNGGLAVLDSSTSPFSGRFPLPEDTDNNNWLDSMDYQKMVFTLASGYNAVGFFMTDPNDQGGRMDIRVGGETYELDFINDIFGGKQPNEGAFYLSFYAKSDISALTFYSNNSNDGYGIDNVTVGRVPEPGTLALLGLGLVGLGLSRRRQSTSEEVAA